MLARQHAEAELAALYRERAIQRAKAARARPKRDAELRWLSLDGKHGPQSMPPF
jgi:hypothetical protein